MPIEIASKSEPVRPTVVGWDSTATELTRCYRRVFARAENILVIGRHEAVPPRHDRFLESLAGDAQQTQVEVIRAIRERTTTGDRRELGELCDVLVELHDIQSRHRDAVGAERLRMLATTHDVSNRLSPAMGTASLLERAAEAICDLPGIERSMVFQREGAILRAKATAFVEHDEWARDCQAFSAEKCYDLTPQRPETLIVLRRSAAIVTDAMNDPNAFRPIVHKLETTSYVGAPIIAYGEVVATVHGDAYFSKRSVDEVDRDVLAAFASALGPLVERAILIDHLRSERQSAERMSRRILGAPDDRFDAAMVDSPRISLQGPPWQTPNSLMSALTRREYEILQLMIKGATNAEIGRTLFLSEGTVKSHVRHILRKFGVANRGQAVAAYLDSIALNR